MKESIVVTSLGVVIVLNLLCGWNSLGGKPHGFHFWWGFVNLGVALGCMGVLWTFIKLWRSEKP